MFLWDRKWESVIICSMRKQFVTTGQSASESFSALEELWHVMFLKRGAGDSTQFKSQPPAKNELIVLMLHP